MHSSRMLLAWLQQAVIDSFRGISLHLDTPWPSLLQLRLFCAARYGLLRQMVLLTPTCRDILEAISRGVHTTSLHEYCNTHSRLNTAQLDDSSGCVGQTR